MSFDKLGAFVTNPVTYHPWSPARGTRIVPLDAGVLMHTGLPNPGVRGLIRGYRNLWNTLPVPVIVHLIASTEEDVAKGAGYLDNEESVDAIELGLSDDISADAAAGLVEAATRRAEKPVLVRLPVFDAYEIADAVVEAEPERWLWQPPRVEQPAINVPGNSSAACIWPAHQTNGTAHGLVCWHSASKRCLLLVGVAYILPRMPVTTWKQGQKSGAGRFCRVG